MTHTSAPRRRTRSIALAAGASLLVVLTFALSHDRASAASASTAAAGPEISSLTIEPHSPIKGHGFVVSFLTLSGGTYTVFESTSSSGGAIYSGSTTGGPVTTKKLGKHLSAGKYTIGVDLTLNGKTKRITKKIVIRKS
jgi:hypothetical protein